ncbi:MAG: PQQ-binding-like beta-propeller repeat protein [Acidobacteriota bacterium]|nr:PQQ-binding-like beta-propeller repeat protein [Acidobacteriota bacterium]
MNNADRPDQVSVSVRRGTFATGGQGRFSKEGVRVESADGVTRVGTGGCCGGRVVRVFLAWILVVPAVAGGQGWGQFRGPTASGVVADNPRLPDEWSSTTNVRWRVPVPGLAWSSPVVANGLVFVTTVVSDGEVETPEGGWYGGGERDAPPDQHHWLVYALDLESGEPRWVTEVHSGVPQTSHHLKNTFGSETPVTDGELVYVLFGNLGLYALDVGGAVRWSVELPAASTRNGWGTASSPVLHDGRLYVVVDNEDQSYLVAFSAETGAELWRVERDEGSNWSTPFVWEHSERTEIVTTGTDRVRSYDLAGQLLWELSGMSTIVIPTPTAAHGLLYIESGYLADFLRPVYAIRPGAAGDISLLEGETSNDYIVWSLAQGGSYHPSPLVYGDYYYTLLDRGMMTCHDARTGAEIYGRQRIVVGEGFTASPWAYNHKIFALSEEGTTYVIEAGPEFRVVGENRLDEFTMATPAILDDSLIIRTAEAVYRIAQD